MLIDTLPNRPAAIVDAHGQIQHIKLEEILPSWKVSTLQLLMPERWRQMRDEWNNRYMDTVQEGVFAKLAYDRKRVRAAAEQPAYLREERLQLAA